jgi:hypothetical protein
MAWSEVLRLVSRLRQLQAASVSSMQASLAMRSQSNICPHLRMWQKALTWEKALDMEIRSRLSSCVVTLDAALRRFFGGEKWFGVVIE